MDVELSGTARGAATAALIEAAASWPEMPLPPEVGAGLDERDGALATAIYRTAVQRWMTLEYLLNQQLTQTMGRMEPAMRGVLLGGAAQLLFMDRLPADAVVDESVELAKRLLRPGAGGMVNAVLRKLVGLDWRSRLPAKEMTEKYLMTATSHPAVLVSEWVGRYGESDAERLLEHSNVHPPVIVRCGGETHPREGVGFEAHEEGGFVVWTGDHAGLTAFLREGEDRWVQDPTAAAAVEATGECDVKLIVDYCAGRGTKTRQLAALHRNATIVASDVDANRYAELERTFAGHERVRVMPMREMEEFEGRADCVVLDVPCSNTGVLARRPEARYRYSQKSIDGLLHVQRTIIERGVKLLAGGGTLLYSTCSVEPRENQTQAKWIEKHIGLKRAGEGERLPGGEGAGYHDGGYWARFR
ncbi:MAG: transcription antitermination factor NusB [Phycisphaerales bacterium]